MDFNRLRGLPYFEQKGFIEKSALKATKALGAIKDDAKKEQEAQGAPSKVPGEIVLAQMSNVAIPLQQEEQIQQVSNNYKKDSCLKSFIKPYGNFFLKNVIFDSLYDAKYASIFNNEPKFAMRGNHNTVLDTQKYNEYRYNVRSELDAFQFDDNIREKIMNKYIENGRQVSETFYEKDFKMFKLILAQTIINGLQTRDYSFYTMPLKKDFILKVLENCLNNPNQDFNVIYRNTVLEQQDQQLEEMGITKQAKRDENGNVIGYLIRIPMTSSYDNAYENRVRFIQTHSYHNWCTHTKKALEYIQGGDFVIYEPNNQSFSNIAFRYYNGEITELVNNKNDGNIEINDIAYYESICNSFPELRPDFSEDIINKYDPAIIEKNIRENITRKPYEEINTYQLFDINECFASDEGRKEVLKQFNIAYLNAFLNRPNLKETISFDDIENLNIIFRNSEDENIQILLDKIKAVYSNSPQAASSLIVPF